jgi:uncharacterized protein (AIM24 family)
VGKRVLTGESVFMTHFSNAGAGKKRVAFAAPYPGKIIPIDMAKINGDLLCQKDGFLCAALGTEIGIAFTKRLGTGFFGVIHVGGTVVKKTLKNETLRVDTGCIAAFTAGVNYDIESAGGLKSMFFGGEGFFLATLSGTGVVMLQSLPFSRMADRILQHAPSAGGSRKGEGSLLGSLGGLIDGDNR